MGIAKFEFSEDYEFVVMNKDENNGFLEVKHIFKKKEPVKDFDWYVEQYMILVGNNIYHTNKLIPIDDSNRMFTKLWGNFMDYKYDLVSFEFRIGLLKFICDDLFPENKRNENMSIFLRKESIGQMCSFSYLDKIYAICPKDFINSLFNG